MNKESYMHSAAKNIVADWYMQNPMLIALYECPIIINGDELDTTLWCYKKYFSFIYKDLSEYPDVNDLFNLNLNFSDKLIEFIIPDLIILNRNSKEITHVIEITHKHPLSALKKRLYCASEVIYYELSADWVMHQTGLPDQLVPITTNDEQFEGKLNTVWKPSL